MSDQTIGLPVDGVGKKIDTEELTVSSVTVQRERMQIAGALDTEIAAILASDPGAGAFGIIVRQAALVSPKASVATVATVAAGSTGSVDSDQLTSSVTGKLLGFEASGSAGFRVDLQTVLNGVATTKLTRVSRSEGISWQSPHKDLITQVESATVGFDGFRLLFTNLDTGLGNTDFHGTFLWDEV